MIARGKGILDTKSMMESIGPELGIELCTKQKRTNRVGNSQMGALDRTILVGGISASGTEDIAETLEKSLNFRIVVKFTTLVHVDVFTSAFGGMVSQELTQPMNRGSLGETGVTIESARKVI